MLSNVCHTVRSNIYYVSSTFSAKKTAKIALPIIGLLAAAYYYYSRKSVGTQKKTISTISQPAPQQTNSGNSRFSPEALRKDYDSNPNSFFIGNFRAKKSKFNALRKNKPEISQGLPHYVQVFLDCLDFYLKNKKDLTPFEQIDDVLSIALIKLKIQVGDFKNFNSAAAIVEDFLECYLESSQVCSEFQEEETTPQPEVGEQEWASPESEQSEWQPFDSEQDATRGNPLQDGESYGQNGLGFYAADPGIQGKGQTHQPLGGEQGWASPEFEQTELNPSHFQQDATRWDPLKDGESCGQFGLGFYAADPGIQGEKRAPQPEVGEQDVVRKHTFIKDELKRKKILIEGQLKSGLHTIADKDTRQYRDGKLYAKGNLEHIIYYMSGNIRFWNAEKEKLQPHLTEEEKEKLFQYKKSEDGRWVPANNDDIGFYAYEAIKSYQEYYRNGWLRKRDSGLEFPDLQNEVEELFFEFYGQLNTFISIENVPVLAGMLRK